MAPLGGCGKSDTLTSDQPPANPAAVETAGAADAMASGRIPPQMFEYKSIDVSVDRTDLVPTFRQAIDEYKPVFAALGYSLSFSGASAKRKDCAGPTVLKTSFLLRDGSPPVRAQCVGTFYHEQPLPSGQTPDQYLRTYLKGLADFWRAYRRDPSIIKTM